MHTAAFCSCQHVRFGQQVFREIVVGPGSHRVCRKSNLFRQWYVYVLISSSHALRNVLQRRNKIIEPLGTFINETSKKSIWRLQISRLNTKCNLATNLFPNELPDAQGVINQVWSAARLADSLSTAGIGESIY